MSRILIIAGPQAAGKTTVINKLIAQPYNVEDLFPGKNPPLLFPLQESRQIIVHKEMLLGAIFMTAEQEMQVIECDLHRMNLIQQRNHRPAVYVDECNIFTIAHALAHGVTQVQDYWDQYVAKLAKLNARVIFIDLPPEVSWERRRRRYEKRLIYFEEDEHAAIMQHYHDYLFTLYPLLHHVFNSLQFPKDIVSGQMSEENVLKAVCQKVTKLTNDMDP